MILGQNVIKNLAENLQKSPKGALFLMKKCVCIPNFNDFFRKQREEFRFLRKKNVYIAIRDSLCGILNDS